MDMEAARTGEEMDLPWWAAYVPTAIPLAVLALVLIWTLLSQLSLVPSRLTPWALSTATIWIDKTGINQETPETAAAGVAAAAEGDAVATGEADRRLCVVEPASGPHTGCCSQCHRLSRRHLGSVCSPGARSFRANAFTIFLHTFAICRSSALTPASRV